MPYRWIHRKWAVFIHSVRWLFSPNKDIFFVYLFFNLIYLNWIWTQTKRNLKKKNIQTKQTQNECYRQKWFESLVITEGRNRCFAQITLEIDWWIWNDKFVKLWEKKKLGKLKIPFDEAKLMLCQCRSVIKYQVIFENEFEFLSNSLSCFFEVNILFPSISNSSSNSFFYYWK